LRWALQVELDGWCELLGMAEVVRERGEIYFDLYLSFGIDVEEIRD
jgi:hypothetical protein